MHLVRPGAKEVRLAVVSIAKRIVVVEDEVQIVKEVDDNGRVRHHQKTRRRVAAIDVLAPDIQRWSQHAAGFPANRLFALAAGIPDDGFTLAIQDVKPLFEEVSLRLGLCPRGRLAKITDVKAFAANQIDVGSLHARSQPLPGFDFGPAQITDVVVPMYGETLLFEPFIPGIDIRLVPGAEWRNRPAVLFPRRVMVMVVTMTMITALIEFTTAVILCVRLHTQERAGGKQAEATGCCSFYKLASRD